jgi:hypothetical protein
LALGAAAAASPACAWRQLGRNADAALGMDVSAYLAGLDRTLDAMSNPLGGILGRRPDADRALDRNPRARELVRKSLRSLVMVSAFHDLPEETRLHPAVQQRMWRAMPDMDDAVTGMSSLFASMSLAERERAMRTFRARPELPMQIAESIDAEASTVGFALKGRARLRSLGSTLSWRLKHQPATLIFDDCVGKVERIVAKRGSEEQRDRLLAMEMTQTAFWSAAAAQTTSTSTISPEGEEPGAPRFDPPVPEASEEEEEAVESESARERRRVRYSARPLPPEVVPEKEEGNRVSLRLIGGLALGFAVISIGSGLALIATGALGFGGATLGAILLFVGIGAIVGGIFWLANSDKDRD